MSFVVLGVNHHHTPVADRARLAFSPEQLPGALESLKQSLGITQAIILSTCNRVEIYAMTSEPQNLLTWLFQYHDIHKTDFESLYYQKNEVEALKHLVRVASGLDSMVLGEPQIFGQLKSAYAISEQHGMMGSELSSRFQWAFATTKQVRHHTGLGHCPVSIALSSIRLAQQNLSLNNAHVLVIGAGQTGRLLLQHLISGGVKEITLTNRTLENAFQLASTLQPSQPFHVEPLSQLDTLLSTVDLVITATRSPDHLLTKYRVQAAMNNREKALWLLDISEIPNIDPTVSEVEKVSLKTLDHLQQMISHNTHQRSRAAMEAEKLIDAALLEFKPLSAPYRDLIAQLRQQFNQICEQELTESLKQLNNGTPAPQVLKQFAHRLSHKWTHQPTQHFKNLIQEEEHQSIAQIKKLFGLLHD